MLNLKIVFYLLVTTVALTQAKEITELLKAFEIIPDVIAEGPQEFLEIKYKNGVIAEFGNELTPTQVKNQPTVEWNAEKYSYYTLIMTDPDAPSRSDPKFREFHHWLVVNIPGKDIGKGEILTEYVGSGPPKGTGLHRYVFLVYKQPAKLEFDEPRISNTNRQGRPKFSAKKFAEKYSLGVPLAVNFYQAQWDNYVPILSKQLGG